MSAKLRQFAAEVCYHDTERLLDLIVWEHVKKHGGDFEELRADANLWFMSAFRRYDSGKHPQSEFPGWLGHIVRCELLEVRRRHARQVHARPLDERLSPGKVGRHRMTDILLDLGEDARAVARLVIDTPGDLRLPLACEQGGAGDEDKYTVRRVLRQYLKDTLGWGDARVNWAYRELQRALS